MFVSGFTIVRNAVKYDYPVVESILSLLPICDEVIVLIGQSEDQTLALIESIQSDKIKIHHSVWDDTLREGGKVLAIETDKAKQLVSKQADWCIYLQADEVIPESSYDTILESMQNFKNDAEIEGLLFKYLHFFGSYSYIASSRDFYRHEIRIVRNDPQIQSYKDAQGFRKNGHKLKVISIDAYVYHYGWVRHPQTMSEKIKHFHQLWHSDQWIQAQKQINESFDYNAIDAIDLFKEQHPKVMLNRIATKNWEFVPNLNSRTISFRKKILYFIESLTGYRIGEYKNYQLLKHVKH
jgi:hypothetical protein